jgi:hypothetical protein
MEIETYVDSFHQTRFWIFIRLNKEVGHIGLEFNFDLNQFSIFITEQRELISRPNKIYTFNL